CDYQFFYFLFFFFFQAEDGIRDLYVTGVQTCALPICPRISRRGWRRTAKEGSYPVAGSAPAPPSVEQARMTAGIPMGTSKPPSGRAFRRTTLDPARSEKRWTYTIPGGAPPEASITRP